MFCDSTESFRLWSIQFYLLFFQLFSVVFSVLLCGYVLILSSLLCSWNHSSGYVLSAALVNRDRTVMGVFILPVMLTSCWIYTSTRTRVIPISGMLISSSGTGPSWVLYPISYECRKFPHSWEQASFPPLWDAGHSFLIHSVGFLQPKFVSSVMLDDQSCDYYCRKLKIIRTFSCSNSRV